MMTTTTLEKPVITPAGQSAGVPTAAPPRAATRKRKHPSKLLVHLALLLICTGFLLPFFWMFSTSLKPADQAMEFPPRFIPKTIPLYHYQTHATPIPQN